MRRRLSSSSPLSLVARALWVVCALLVTLAGDAYAANDPNLVWHTLDTPHFRISYYTGEEELAQKVAGLAESINERLSPILGWAPKEKVEISLTDQTDSANGITSTIPYNSIRLYVTAPDDMSPLGDYDDWYLELITHEYTHTLHLDNIHGIPALVNAIMGKTLAPNQQQPRWILEGLAVYEESERTSGGRLRSSMWNMYMRADILEGNVAPLDVFTNTPRRFPQGNIWYLYGSFFMRWIAQTYGDDAIRRMIYDYGGQPIPLGINRSVRRATGHTFEELYPAWIASLRRAYGAQVSEIEKKGLRQGIRLTHGGNTAQHPTWIPGTAWGDHAGDLLYFRDDGHSTGGLYALPLLRDAQGNVSKIKEDKAELVVRTNGASAASFAPDGSVVFDSTDYTNRIFAFTDLFRMAPGVKGPRGLEGNRERLTNGFRASEPSVSPDGGRVAFATNHRGTSYLQVADLGPDGVSHVRSLVRSNPYEQVYTPEWSPDNRHVAYSVWTRGGYRDIRYVDSFDGSYVEVTHDRAIDGGPAFSPDGKWLFFHSDRTHVANIYAWEISSGRLMQVTNVLTGAYQPAISSDGKTLAYTGYTHTGYDVFAMRLDPATWTEAEPYVDDRPAMHPDPPARHYAVEDYNPLETLRPRSYSVQITPGNYGQAIIVSVGGSDIAGHHIFNATMTTEVEKPELQLDVGYTYARLPVDLGIRAFRSITPRGGYQLGQNYKPTWTQETLGLQTGVGWVLPGAFEGQSGTATYTLARLGGDLPFPKDKLDPYETPTFPTRGVLGSIDFSWGYSNAQRYLWSIGPEDGFSLGTSLSLTHPDIGSEFSGFAARGDFSTYYTMPWLRHHSLGLHAGGGTSAGNFPGRGPFYVGGFVDLPLYDTVKNILVQGGITLRGYPSVVEAGRNFALFNAEYRFPIVNVDRGLSTLPVFLQRISGNVFLDYGSAFNDADAALFKTGTGAELWFESILGYTTGFTFRLGYARGWASGGLDKVYFVAVVPF